MMIDKITELEKQMINSARRTQLEGTGNFCSAETFLEPWAKRKGTLFDMFGQELIIKYPVEFTMTSEEICNYLNSGNNRDENKITDCKFMRAFYNWISEYFYDKKMTRDDYDEIRVLSEGSVLSKKTFDRDITMSDGKIKITKGTKLIKVFKKLNDTYHFASEEDYEDFRLKHSMLFNTASLKGNYCLSIHPLDYITLSDNASKWTSCMSWREKGCYRLGTIEMMTSPFVVVAYLESKEPMEMLAGSKWGEWNNKKWRTMFYVDDTIITSIKSYPYASEQLTKFGLDRLTELAERYYKDVEYEREVRVTSDNYFEKVWREDEDWERSIEFSAYYMYNDFGCTNHYFRFSDKFTKPESRRKLYEYYEYNGPAVCVCCGRENNFSLGGGEETETMCCDDCIETTYCDICGDRIYSDRDIYSCVGHECICGNCSDDTTYLEYLEDNVYYNEIATTYIAIKDENDEFVGSTLRLKNYEEDDSLEYSLGRPIVRKKYGNFGNRESFIVFNSFEDFKRNYEKIFNYADSEDMSAKFDSEEDLEDLRDEFFMKL